MSKPPVEVCAIFDRASTRFHVHRAGCGMLRTASRTGRGRRVLVTDPDEIEDLIARGYQPVYCRCLKP